VLLVLPLLLLLLLLLLLSSVERGETFSLEHFFAFACAPKLFPTTEVAIVLCR